MDVNIFMHGKMMRSTKCVIGGLACLLAVSAKASPTAEQVRGATVTYVLEKKQSEGMEKISAYLGKRLGLTARVPSRDLSDLVTAAECVRFMELSQEVRMAPETVAWLLGSGRRLHTLIDSLAPENEARRCLGTLEGLRAHDPAGSDDYFDLMVAIALVTDRLGFLHMHGQMGDDLLSGVASSEERYDYFKALYSGGRAKLDYDRLGVSELVFVVHVPVPLSELVWARDQVEGALSRWDEMYSGIAYNHDRLENSRFQWDQGAYRLCDIQRLGGICVDQAYFAVMTARAHGIPAIYFQGSGKSANHAWFAYMKGPGDWVLDVGRYQGEEYTTGFAVHPQTRLEMTDHDVEYTCEHSLYSADAQKARAYVSFAEVLMERDPEKAIRCARRARGLSKRLSRAWEIEQQLLAEQEEYGDLIELFAQKKDAFRKYPDILVESAMSIAEVLRKAGKGEEADRLMRSVAGAVKDERDDLLQSFESQRIDQIIASGDMKKARREMEQMLDEQREQGNKAIGLIPGYIKLTHESGQTRQAARFLEDYIEFLLQRYDLPPAYQEGVLSMLLTAYENDGDAREAAKVRTRIRRL